MRIVVEYNPEELSLKTCEWLERNVTPEIIGYSTDEKQYYLDSLMCEEELENNITVAEYQFLETLQEQKVDYLAISIENI